MKTVMVALEDQYLAALIAEQLKYLPGIQIADTEAPDLVIGRVKTLLSVPHLLLGGKAEPGCEILPLPIRLGEMNDRLRYMLSGRNRFADNKIIAFGNYTLNAEDGVMTNTQNGAAVRLTDKEKLMILSLYEEDTRTLDRAGLLQKVWFYADSAETHTLETHLYRLRLKLEESFGLKDLIITKDGFYSLKIN